MTEYANLKLSTKEINKKILYNTILMIHRRNNIKESNVEKIISKLGIDYSDTIINFKIEENKYSLNIINSKLNSITNNSQLDEYLKKNLNIKKFVVIKEPSKRVIKQIFKIYKNCEFFHHHELIEDLISKIFIPKHILLNDDEKKILLEKINQKELSKIYSTDIISRYYKAKEGDIFKIERPNITCGKSIFYREVKKGKIDIII